MELGVAPAIYGQDLPHLAVALLDRVALGAFDLFAPFVIVREVLLVGFPLVVVWSMRRMSVSMVTAAGRGSRVVIMRGGRSRPNGTCAP